MTDQEYLMAVLEDQTLPEDSPELEDLRWHRNQVETLLRAKFGSAPTIRYGGSYIKGTMIRESYDLDLTCYFPHDDACAGTTLQEIFQTVERVLREKYWTEAKGSAIRLRSRDDARSDLRIDVVPGRFVEANEGDVHLYRSTGEKAYLKTNLDTHIAHVKDSDVIPAIRLMKLWSHRNHLGIKTFALELLVIRLLEDREGDGQAEQLQHVLTAFRDDPAGLSIEDPANPEGNDLSEMLNDSVRLGLSSAARSTLNQVDEGGWEKVFGPVKGSSEAGKLAALRRMAAATTVRPKPYADG